MSTPKVFVFAISALLIAIAGALILYNLDEDRPSPEDNVSPTQQPSPTSPTTTLSPDDISLCDIQDLQGTINLEPAAGNIFGSITISNISDNPCRITGDNYIDANYTESNITINNQGLPGPSSITLSPNDTVYSQVHYPNGPQCTGETHQTEITFTYNISEASTIALTSPGITQLNLTVCNDSSEITTIETWSLSTQPPTQ